MAEYACVAECDEVCLYAKHGRVGVCPLPFTEWLLQQKRTTFAAPRTPMGQSRIVFECWMTMIAAHWAPLPKCQSNVTRRKSGGSSQPAARCPRHNHKAPWHTYGVCGENLI